MKWNDETMRTPWSYIIAGWLVAGFLIALPSMMTCWLRLFS